MCLQSLSCFRMAMEPPIAKAETQSLLDSENSVQTPAADSLTQGGDTGVELHVSGLNYFVQRSHGRSCSGLACCGSRRQSGYDVLDGSNEADRPILRDVSLHLKPGGMLAVLGNSGETLWVHTEHTHSVFKNAVRVHTAVEYGYGLIRWAWGDLLCLSLSHIRTDYIGRIFFFGLAARLCTGPVWYRFPTWHRQ